MDRIALQAKGTSETDTGNLWMM